MQRIARILNLEIVEIMPIVRLEGQDIPLSPEQAATDESVINTLLPYYPNLAGAEIQREIRGEQEYILITQRVGTKGNAKLLAALVQSPEQLNPAWELSLQLNALQRQERLSLDFLLALQPQIQRAIAVGEEDALFAFSTAQRLKDSPPLASPLPILGI